MQGVSSIEGFDHLTYKDLLLSLETRWEKKVQQDIHSQVASTSNSQQYNQARNDRPHTFKPRCLQSF